MKQQDVSLSRACMQHINTRFGNDFTYTGNQPRKQQSPPREISGSSLGVGPIPPWPSPTQRTVLRADGAAHTIRCKKRQRHTNHKIVAQLERRQAVRFSAPRNKRKKAKKKQSPTQTPSVLSVRRLHRTYLVLQALVNFVQANVVSLSLIHI